MQKQMTQTVLFFLLTPHVPCHFKCVFFLISSQFKMQVCSCILPLSEKKKPQHTINSLLKISLKRNEKEHTHTNTLKVHIHTSSAANEMPSTPTWRQATNTKTSNLSVHIQGHPNSSTSTQSLLSSWSDNEWQNEWVATLHAHNPTPGQQC